MSQGCLFEDRVTGKAGGAASSVDQRFKLFPRTRYQGSKRKLALEIVKQVGGLAYESVLDAFGGTGAVSYAFKLAGKRVVYNDILQFNQQIGTALIENDSVRLNDDEIKFVQIRDSGFVYDDFIERTFDGIYYTQAENRWLDGACQNILRLSCPTRRALAWFALFQAALIKRPYNLFHRSNLSMRLADVPRSFGNKATWDRPFEHYFTRFARAANEAVFRGEQQCRSMCGNVLEAEGSYDLVYIDTPYVSRRGIGTDYLDFYHFLEGMVHYDHWGMRMDRGYKHLPFRSEDHQPWARAHDCLDAFEKMFCRFERALLCVSYRSDGIPSIDELASLMKRTKKQVFVSKLAGRQYALSHSKDTQEMLLIGS